MRRSVTRVFRSALRGVLRVLSRYPAAVVVVVGVVVVFGILARVMVREGLRQSATRKPTQTTRQISRQDVCQAACTAAATKCAKNDATCPHRLACQRCRASGVARPAAGQQQQRRRLLTRTAAAAAATATVPWRTGNTTYYNSYPDCCTNSKADQTECEKNNGCAYQGQFEDDTTLSKDEVKRSNIVAFYVPPNDRNRREWDAKFKGRWIRIKYGSKTLDVQVKDTCDDDDCPNDNGIGGCCSTNAKANGNKYLLDLESYTSKRLFDGTPRNEQVQFVFVTGPGGVPVPWSQVGL